MGTPARECRIAQPIRQPASRCSRQPESCSRRSGRRGRGSRRRNTGRGPAGFPGFSSRFPRATTPPLVTSAFSNPSVPTIGRASSLIAAISRRRSSRDSSGPIRSDGIAAAAIKQSASRRGSSSGTSETTLRRPLPGLHLKTNVQILHVKCPGACRAAEATCRSRRAAQPRG